MSTFPIRRCLVFDRRRFFLLSAPHSPSCSAGERSFASEFCPEDYGRYPDPLETSTHYEKQWRMAQWWGLDRYTVKVYHRDLDRDSRENPNLVPAYMEDRILGCLCEHDNYYVNYMKLPLGEPKRCSCGHWFMAVDCR